MKFNQSKRCKVISRVYILMIYQELIRLIILVYCLGAVTVVPFVLFIYSAHPCLETSIFPVVTISRVLIGVVVVTVLVLSGVEIVNDISVLPTRNVRFFRSTLFYAILLVVSMIVFGVALYGLVGFSNSTCFNATLSDTFRIPTILTLPSPPSLPIAFPDIPDKIPTIPDNDIVKLPNPVNVRPRMRSSPLEVPLTPSDINNEFTNLVEDNRPDFAARQIILFTPFLRMVFIPMMVVHIIVSSLLALFSIISVCLKHDVCCRRTHRYTALPSHNDKRFISLRKLAPAAWDGIASV